MQTSSQIKEKIKLIEAELNSAKAELAIAVVREEKDAHIPFGFNVEFAYKSLTDIKSLDLAFAWSATPQGDAYWRHKHSGIVPMMLSDKNQIQTWIINYYRKQQN